MKTTYITTLKVVSNPFLRSSKVPRLFLAQLPANEHKNIKIVSENLPRNSISPALLEIGFKDGKSLKYSWANETAPTKAEEKPKKAERGRSLQDVVEEIERHWRVTSRQEELNS